MLLLELDWLEPCDMLPVLPEEDGVLWLPLWADGDAELGELVLSCAKALNAKNINIVAKMSSDLRIVSSWALALPSGARIGMKSLPFGLASEEAPVW
jgi:hypothetical protein